MDTLRCEGFVDSDKCFAESTLDTTIIRNVLLCGNESRNGYTIPPSAFGSEERVRELYENRLVYANHPSPSTVTEAKSLNGVLASRSIQELAGKIINVRLENGRPRGDIETNGCPMGSLVRDLAEAKLSGVGLSHVAVYQISEGSKGPTIEAVKEVASVDVVSRPATTETFHESTQGTEVKMELNEVLQKQLDKAEAEKAQLIADHAEQVQTLKAAIESAETRTATLKGEKEELIVKVESLTEKVERSDREAEVRTALEAAGLDLNDTDKVSTYFFESLLSQPNKEQRDAMIADRAAAVGKKEGSQETPAAEGVVESTRRQDDKTKKTDVETALSGDIFTS